MTPAATDIHQHLWTPEFVDALRMRTAPPYLSGWTLHLAGEPPFEMDPADHDPELRAKLDDDLAAILVSLSSPLGVETMRPDEAQPLLDAWHAGARALPAPFAAWAAVNHLDPDLDGLAHLLDDGFVGLQVPASLLSAPAAIEALAPVLAVAEAAGRPVFIHPGPVAAGPCDAPGWWPAVVDYVGQLHAAWWSWATAGRALLPSLRVCFAAGAGLAPIHHERFTARGGGALRLDPLTFVDTSSYGPRGLDVLIRVLGIDAVVLGSDRPYAEPTSANLGGAAAAAIRVVNPRHLMEGVRP